MERKVEPGVVWVCRACGKYAADSYKLADVSCFLNAVPCREDSLQLDAVGRATYAEAVEE